MSGVELSTTIIELTQKTRFIKEAKFRQIILKDLENGNLIYSIEKKGGAWKREIRWFASKNENIIDNELALASTENIVDLKLNHNEIASPESSDTNSSEITKDSHEIKNVVDGVGVEELGFLNYFDKCLNKLDIGALIFVNILLSVFSSFSSFSSFFVLYSILG